MSTSTTTATTTNNTDTSTGTAAGNLSLTWSAGPSDIAASVGSSSVHHGDFRDQLFSKGWVVVPNVIPDDRAREYVSRAHDFLESFNLGYNRDDPSTWNLSSLPYNNKGGLYSAYGVGHQQFLWDIRQEPGLIDTFATVWGTSELLVSFDGINISVPLNLQEEQNKGLDSPWPHVDQSPNRRFFHCIQGIANLAPNGPLDGGLMVLRGSKELYNECFDRFAHQRPAEGWTPLDSYHHTPEMLEWMIKEKGCTWHKVEAPAGSVILWDSRTVHYGSIPLSTNPRVASYVCYKPAALISEEYREKKKEAIDQMLTSTHDPVMFTCRPRREPAPNDPGWSVRQVPDERPVLSEVGRKLAGLESY
uniref:Phytanoil-CoA dioxygenase n=1 Tax=Phaffia rhodozyma TaxID=264483 RepID=A0A1C9U6B8_PHARH|nr:phytanoil-CoA dioxygenase [Phaffia rhodozyma]